MTDEELRKELEFIRECLNEEEEILSFMLTKTTLHVGSGQVNAMNEETDEKCQEYRDKIKKIEDLLHKHSV
ncbi:MAG: hypothetical protein OEW04_02815 [Nitrospirota bacterium]|nr:hypothetical protein [Nitrospirota bacterium]